MTGRHILLCILLVPSAAVAVGLFFWVVRNDEQPRERFAPPAECRWMEIEQPGQWEQTCDPDQKRKF
jgi:hypothetical protein